MHTLLFVGSEDVLGELPRSTEFRILLASTGREALDLIKRAEPDVIVILVERTVDVRAAFASVLAEERGVPFIICTTTCECPEEVRGWPAEACVVSPGELDDLMTTVKRVLARRARNSPATAITGWPPRCAFPAAAASTSLPCLEAGSRTAPPPGDEPVDPVAVPGADEGRTGTPS